MSKGAVEMKVEGVGPWVEIGDADKGNAAAKRRQLM